jgi:hypothetical protein
MHKQQETLSETPRRLRPEGISPMKRFTPLKKSKGSRRSGISNEALTNIFKENYLRKDAR